MLRLISYLAPSIPAGFYETVAQAIHVQAGIDVRLQFEERISGPLPGDENPFFNGAADVGFVCSPTYKWFRNDLELLPLPVPNDSRANGKAVYFSDIAVRADSGLKNFNELRGRRWAFNDRNSQSGWFSMVNYIAPEKPHEFFSDLRQAGSHLESLRLLNTGDIDAAGIDSNALRYYMKNENDNRIRVIESLGPFPIQPVVVRKSISPDIKQTLRRALLGVNSMFGEQLMHYGFERFIEPEFAAYED